MDKMINVKDKRVIKTRTAIIKATVSLISRKNIEQITIKEIADMAMINRKTFYSHYNSVYDVLNDIEDEIIKALIQILDSTDFSEERMNPYALFKKLTEMINKDKAIFHGLIQSSSHSQLIKKIKEVLKEHLIIQFRNYYPDDSTVPGYVLEYVASGMISVYQQWFDNDGEKVSLEDLSQLCGILLFDGVNGVIREIKEAENKEIQ